MAEANDRNKANTRFRDEANSRGKANIVGNDIVSFVKIFLFLRAERAVASGV